MCLLLLAVLLVPAASAGYTATPATYLVRPGDNLSLIAQRFGTTVGDLRRDNALKSDVIHVGDRLRISQPFRRGNATVARWLSPVRHPGRVLRPFGPYKASGILMPRTGTEIATPIGTMLLAPAVGVVRHFGSLDGFGHVLIIEHPGNYATVLSPCDPASLQVDVGQAVLAGDAIARTGAPPEEGAQPFAHVELRLGDRAVAPDRLLR